MTFINLSEIYRIEKLGRNGIDDINLSDFYRMGSLGRNGIDDI